MVKQIAKLAGTPFQLCIVLAIFSGCDISLFEEDSSNGGNEHKRPQVFDTDFGGLVLQTADGLEPLLGDGCLAQFYTTCSFSKDGDGESLPYIRLRFPEEIAPGNSFNHETPLAYMVYYYEGSLDGQSGAHGFEAIEFNVDVLEFSTEGRIIFHFEALLENISFGEIDYSDFLFPSPFDDFADLPEIHLSGEAESYFQEI